MGQGATLAVPIPGTLTTEAAFAECARITRSHYENFPVASLFLPHEQRPYIQAVYAFSRAADDMADEGSISPAERLRRIDEWEAQLRACYQGDAGHPVFIALRETVERTGLPMQPLLDLLTAFRQDVTCNRYQSYDELLAYCRNSANPVGRIVLAIFGYRDEHLLELSDSICTALQLANFWQDISVDLPKDRCYLPLEDMRTFGYTISDWQNRVYDDRFRQLLRYQVERTHRLFIRGAELPSLVNRDLQLELRLVWFGGNAILRSIAKQKYDVWSQRPSLGIREKAGILLRGLFRRSITPNHIPVQPWDLT